jgi:hypothetical protein
MNWNVLSGLTLYMGALFGGSVIIESYTQVPVMLSMIGLTIITLVFSLVLSLIKGELL